MNTNLLSPKMHGLNDYLLSGVLLAAPPLLGFDKASQQVYKGFSLNLLGYNAFTNHSLAIKRMIPTEEHYKMDYANLVGMAAATLHPSVRQNKKVLLFHLGILAVSALNLWLTDRRTSPLSVD